jgi:hypothetical protein
MASSAARVGGCSCKCYYFGMRIHLYFAIAFALAFAQTVEASDLCSRLSQRFVKAPASDTRPKICFDGNQYCSKGSIDASIFWKNSDTPDQIENLLRGYSDWSAWVTEVKIPRTSGSIIQIERRVGTASCVRNTYLYKFKGKYRVIESESLDDLSAEGSNCGDAFVELVLDPKNAVIAVRDSKALSAYAINPPNFELKLLCTTKNFSYPRKLK